MAYDIFMCSCSSYEVKITIKSQRHPTARCQPIWIRTETSPYRSKMSFHDVVFARLDNSKFNSQDRDTPCSNLGNVSDIGMINRWASPTSKFPKLTPIQMMQHSSSNFCSLVDHLHYQKQSELNTSTDCQALAV